MRASIEAKYGKLIAALMAADVEFMQEIERQLTEEFGVIDLRSPVFPFHFTEYYTPEMGGGLQKQFISFAEPIQLEHLPEIKLLTNDLEMQFAIGEKRRINIDPGYVTHAQMVLATTKDYSHRVYLGKGIHADVSYVCRKKKFQCLEWTYPDYREPLAIEFFDTVRATFLQQRMNLESLI